MYEPTLLETFAGIGGFSIAFESVGFKTIGFVEWNDTKRIIIKYHWPDVPIFGDIREFRGTRGMADVITGGVPCQPASALGQQRGTSDERWLWPEAIRLVSEIRPTYFVFENPPALLTLENGQAWNGIVSGLAALGYDLLWDVIPAAAFGAGHLRERVILVGSNAESICPRISANKDHAESVGRHSRNESSSDGDFESSADANSANHREALTADANDEGLQRLARNVTHRSERAQPRRPIATPDLRGRVTGRDWWHEVNTGIPVLVNGLPSKLVEAASLCAGDAICPQVAKVFAQAIYNQIMYDHT